MSPENVNIVWMRKDNPLAWVLMPQFKERAKEFCTKLETDTDPGFLEEAIHINFVSDEPKMLMLAGYSDDGMVGHAIATLDEIARLHDKPRRVLTILQFEADVYVERDLLKAAFHMMLEWGRCHECDMVQLLTQNEGRERLFSRYGFQRHRILMRRSIDDT